MNGEAEGVEARRARLRAKKEARMNRKLSLMVGVAVAVMLVAAGTAWAQETAEGGKKVQLKDVPAAVQKTIAANLQGGQILSIVEEIEDGVHQFEIKSSLNGKSRSFDVSTAGALLEVEETTTLDAIPAAAKAAILKQVGAGKLKTVETVQKTGQPLMYSSDYTDKAGKSQETLVKADGTKVPEKH
jgi:hypothetical protein